MSRSKRDILDTEKMLERLTELLAEHAVGKQDKFFNAACDAKDLRRISMTLHTWYELECGTEAGYIARLDDNNLPYHRHPNGAQYQIPDREAGALKRLKKIMARYPTLTAYVQTDPRGCALYILKPGDVPQGERAYAYYSRGLAVYK